MEKDYMKHIATYPVICNNCDSKVSIGFTWYEVCGRVGEDVILCEDCFKRREIVKMDLLNVEKKLEGGKK